jgi:hypothetical protein
VALKAETNGIADPMLQGRCKAEVITRLDGGGVRAMNVVRLWWELPDAASG